MREEFEDYYDSAKEFFTCEVDEGGRGQVNTPKDTFYFNNSPFQALADKSEEQGSRTIDSTTQPVAEEFSPPCETKISYLKRPIKNTWTGNASKKKAQNLSYNASTVFKKNKLADEHSESRISKYTNLVSDC